MVLGWVVVVMGGLMGRAQIMVQAADANECGIGALIEADGNYPKVAWLAAGGAADRDGRLKVGDHIAGVAEGDGAFVDCKWLDINPVIADIRGKQGSTVRLLVIPAGAADPSKREIIALTRGELYIAELSPDDKARVAGLLTRLTPAVREVVEGDGRRRAGEVAAAAGLNESGSAALVDVAVSVADQNLVASVQCIGDYLTADLKPGTPEMRDLKLRQADAAIGQDPATAARWMQWHAGESPAEAAAWKACLKAALTPAQAAAWEAAEARQREQAGKEIAGYVADAAFDSKNTAMGAMQQDDADIRMGLNLSQERLDELDALENAVATEYGEAGKAAAEKALLAMSEEDRRQAVLENQISAWRPPMTLAGWKEGLAKLFTPEEMRAAHTAMEDRKNLRAQAIGKVLLGLLDEEIDFTAAQRRALEPVATAMVKNSPELMLQQDPHSFYSVQVSSVYGVIAEGTEDPEVQAILDPVQWQHWQAVRQEPHVDAPYDEYAAAVSLPAADGASTPAPSAMPEPEAVEEAISHFMEEKSVAQREKVFAQKLLKAEDAARVLQLPDDAAERLKTAACRSADIAMSEWSSEAERTVRKYLGDALPDTVEKRLELIEENNVVERMAGNAGNAGNGDAGVLWDIEVGSQLSPEQLKAWKAETDARNEYRAEAIGGWVACSFSQRFGLTPDQAAKMRTLLSAVVEKYEGKLSNYFHFTGTWYMETSSMFVPVAGIPEEELKGLLTKEQMQNWSAFQRGMIDQDWAIITK